MHFSNAEDICERLSSCSVPGTSVTGIGSTTSQNKRRKDAYGGDIAMPAQRQKPFKSSEDMMKSVGVTEEHIYACSVSCGVGGTVPLRVAAREVFRATVMRASSVAPAELQRTCLEEAISTMDHLLSGFVKATAPAGSAPNTTDSSPGLHSTQYGYL
jgi:hypothetical protein